MIDGIKVRAMSLTPSAMEDILQTAADAGHTFGIGYWAEWHPTNKNKIREHNDSPDSKKRGPWIELDHAKLARGCAMALNAGHSLDDIDGATADIIIQFAALGELRYA